MGLFSSRVKGESVALIEVSAGSVGGALVHKAAGVPPVICYGARVSIEAREGEDGAKPLVRAIRTLGAFMIEQGGPILRRAAGSAHLARVLVVVGSPWQETRVRVERLEQETPFTFTHAVMNHAMKRSSPYQEGRESSGESVISTVLNGYETANPFGKRVTRAELTILSSSVDRGVRHGVMNALRAAFHAHEVEIVGAGLVSYRVLRGLYPHQKDFLALDAGDRSTSLAFVKKGDLVDIREIPQGLSELGDGLETAGGAEREAGYRKALAEALADFGARHALPRTIFLVAEDGGREFLKRMLDAEDLRALWLSSDPLSIVPVTPATLAPFVKAPQEGEGDLFLEMLAFFEASRGA